MKLLTTMCRFFKRLKLDYPQQETSRASRRFVKAMKPLNVSSVKLLDMRTQADTSQDIIPENNKFCRNFLDLLKKIFVYDPQERMTAKQALQHPWFKEAATPDDGTEATKIRLQRQEAAEQVAALAASRAPRHNGYSR